MKNKILIGIAVILILFVIVVRYKFKELFAAFKETISKEEIAQLETFKREKEKRIASLMNGDQKVFQLFKKQFDESKAIIAHDTAFTFLYLSDKLMYKLVDLNYIDCLNSKCVIDLKNIVIQKMIASKEREFENKYGSTFMLWYPKLNGEKLLNKRKISDQCSKYFPDLNEDYYDVYAWNGFEKFMNAYNSETRKSQVQNNLIENEYASNVSSARSQLRGGALDYFDQKLSELKSQILQTESETLQFNSSNLGIITYTLSKESFDKQAFRRVADDALEEQWKSNSLNTGEMPYSHCFGSSNECNANCSVISVRTGGADVLVTIKNISGEVVRHAYINTGNTFSFNVPDGRYQVFFYSGTGWNPNKFIKSPSCGSLLGGFVLDENVTKDEYISLFSKEITYELILQRNGNLSTKQSSKDEAF